PAGERDAETADDRNSASGNAPLWVCLSDRNASTRGQSRLPSPYFVAVRISWRPPAIAPRGAGGGGSRRSESRCVSRQRKVESPLADELVPTGHSAHPRTPS